MNESARIEHHIIETDVASFLRRALYEAERYGDDPWVFLRELVQNSRDAGASVIAISIESDDTTESIICRDDGHGMSNSDIHEFFLRLYASNKESEIDAVGYFGVGFWSVLLYMPRIIQIFSSTGDGEVAFEIDIPSLSIQRIPPASSGRGTRIVLIRDKTTQDTTDTLETTVRERLDYYAAHVTPRHASDSIDLRFNNESMGRSFPLPPYAGTYIRKPYFTGVIGFGDTPSIRMYTGGLLVKDVASLREVIPSRTPRLSEESLGWYPVLAININDIRLLMDRKSMVEDDLLYDVVSYCEKALKRLHGKHVRGLIPINASNYILYITSRLRYIWRYAAGLSAGVLAVTAALWFTNSHTADTGEKSTEWNFDHTGTHPVLPDPVDLDFDNWDAVPTTRSADPPLWHLLYSSDAPHLFRLRTMSRFDVSTGFHPVQNTITGPYRTTSTVTSAEPLDIEVKVSGAHSPVVLPLPDDHILSGPVTDESGDSISVFSNQFHRPVVRIEEEGILSYQSLPARGDTGAPPPVTAPMVSYMPPKLRTACHRSRFLPVHDAVSHLEEVISSQFSYAPGTPECGDRNIGWLRCVLNGDSGDCDTLNGLLTYLLRCSDIPADLCVGVVGYRGTALPGLHAWTTYYGDGSWHTADVTSRYESGIQWNQGIIRGDDTGLQSIRETPPDEAVKDSSEAIPDTRSRSFPSPVPWVFLLLVPGAIWFYISRKKRRRSFDEYEMKQIVSLFRRLDMRGREHDPLGLGFRPIFRTISGTMLSLRQLHRRSIREVLLGMQPDSTLASHLEGDTGILLDASHELTHMLHSFIPPVVWLDHMESALLSDTVHPPVASIERTLRQFDARLRIRTVPGSRECHEFSLRLTGDSYPHNYILLGEEHPASVEILRSSVDSTLQRFTAIESFLSATTHFISQREFILTTLASRVKLRSGDCNAEKS